MILLQNQQFQNQENLIPKHLILKVYKKNIFNV